MGCPAGYSGCHRADVIGDRRGKLEGNVIGAIDPAIGMQLGSTPYYDIRVTRTGGKPITIGGGIRDKREAQYLAGLLLKAVKGEQH